ncbi:Disease resistance protein TAO1 [Cardamine amara subsp. amara]|uniref:ADP-ribosyl cyclase/cyclic ADP-ribose hydrolase n=1 Tax=Cardamine amara subsp. amara TaxID=228776 RepID=A0ABD1C7I2_CARAN
MDNEIKRGESIGPELIREIRGSKIAIILLSRNYASSKWCLDELVEIMKCREASGLTVMTIFYEVDPSDVKKLVGDFGKVFKKTCAGKTEEDIRRWTQALVEAATVAGYDSRKWDNEAAMIERIANDVSNELMNSVPSNDFDCLVGRKAHLENMEPFLHLSSNEVRMIGIWGPSGIGKSTIARFLFEEYSHGFQLSAFMENIKGRYPKPCYDECSAKLQLQADFLSKIINQKDMKIRRHLGVAKDRLKDKKVFVVLDDVDQLAQLDAMAKETHWFGPGSRIIITTQDKKVLKAHGIHHIYKVCFPADDEALQIFCMNAFSQNSPRDGFENLARDVTQLSGKLPLGLSVMGSFFRGMSKDEWIREIPRLKTSLDGKIETTLMFSYNGLCEEDQGLFLYIACMFNNERIENVEEHLAKNFIDVTQGLHILAEKSVISISSGYVKMHDLLARLGREIVRKQSIDKPGKRQFLVDPRDICKVLSNTKDCTSVIGINSECGEELCRIDRVLERMPNLQFLRLYGDASDLRSNLPQSLNYLPPLAKLLHWTSFPMKCPPSNFNPVFLVELNMPFSNLEKLWEGIQTIRNLKWMDLSSSSNLKELPDLSTATNLEKLNLSNCSSLAELPSSIGNAINLVELDLSFCTRLVELPSSIWNATNIVKLNLCGCTKLVELPSSTGNTINLAGLNFRFGLTQMGLQPSTGNINNLQMFEISISRGINPRTINLQACSRLKEQLDMGNATNLEQLDLTGCLNMPQIRSSMQTIAMNLSKTGLRKIPRKEGNMSHLLPKILQLKDLCKR